MIENTMLDQWANWSCQKGKFEKYPRWQYQVNEGLPDEEDLKFAGEEGWELAGILGNKLIFKRPLLFKYNEPEIP